MVVEFACEQNIKCSFIQSRISYAESDVFVVILLLLCTCIYTVYRKNIYECMCVCVSEELRVKTVSVIREFIQLKSFCSQRAIYIIII